MTEMAHRFVNHTLLWHFTHRDHADSISREGFRLSRNAKRWYQRGKATWFFYSASPFLKEVVSWTDKAEGDGFLCAVRTDRYRMGTDYAPEGPDVFVFYVPLPKEAIVARFSLANVSSREDLSLVLSEQIQCDISAAFSGICLDGAIPWHQVGFIASTLRTLDENVYHRISVTGRLLREEMRRRGRQASERLLSLFTEGHPAFSRRFLDRYYGEYPFFHFGRALMVAGAGFLPPLRVLACHDPGVAVPHRSESEGHPGRAPVAALLAEALPCLERTEAVFGAIEMAAMRHFPGDEGDLERIEHWIAQQGRPGVEAASHFIRFGVDCYPSGRGGIAVRMAVAALWGTGEDPFERLSRMADTDYPSTHFNLIRAFGMMKETRAIPYLASSLRDERKQVRALAVEALGRIGNREALRLVKGAADDPANQVRRAVQSVLGG